MQREQDLPGAFGILPGGASGGARRTGRPPTGDRGTDGARTADPPAGDRAAADRAGPDAAGDAGAAAAGRGRGSRAVAVSGTRRRWWPWPAAVAVAFTVLQLIAVPPDLPLGWDESVYVSQVSAHAPAAFFSAPRARGVPVLVWPIAAWTSSATVLRCYLAVASGLALFLVLRVWRTRRPPAVLALAGAVFCGLWVTLFYGPQAMPNLWVALAGLAAVGFFLRAGDDPADRTALWGLAGCTAAMALMRPTDAVWLSLPLLAAPLLVRRWRRVALPAVVLLGLAAGSAEWVIEAYADYGGLAARLHRASAIQGGLGWHVAVVDELRALRGNSLCRPCAGRLPNPVLVVWWFALPVAAAAALALAVRVRRAGDTGLLAACAVTSAVPYLFFIDYAAPRFLLPVYALLAIPVAQCLLWLATGAARPGWRPVTVALVAVALAGHLSLQFLVATRVARNTMADHRVWEHVVSGLRALGVRPPCLLSGPSTIPMAYYAGCGSISVGGSNGNITVAGIRAAARTQHVADLVPPGGRPPSYAARWPWYRLPGQPSLAGYRVYLEPRTTP